MTSVLNVDTIADAAGTGPVALTKQSAAKAWVNFNGIGTVSTRDSLNTSSISDNGTGYYSLNFSTAMSNINYSISGGTNGSNNSYPTAATAGSDIRFNTNTASPYKTQPTTSAFTMSVSQDNALGTALDAEWMYGNVLGDLA